MTSFSPALRKLGGALSGALWVRIVAGIFAMLVLLALLLVFFPWDVLRGPINRHVSEQTGRKFEITRKLDVKLGRTTRVFADGIEFANPSWAREPYLVKAEAAEIQIRLWPLLMGRIELPLVSLQKPQLGLQIEPDGRRTWSLAKDTADESKVPAIGQLLIDQGVITYFASARGADIKAEVGLAAEASSDMPLSYKAAGKWKGEPFTAHGRAGGVLQLSADADGKFPLEIDAAAGQTRLKARGSVTNLAEFGSIDAKFELQGRSLADLYKLVGVVLPGTPPYKLRGQLDKQGLSWAVSQISGVLGKSDLNGALTFDNTKPVPMLTGKVQSKLLDFEDLGPIIGKSSDNVPPAMAKAGKTGQDRPTRAGRVLPDAKLDFARLKAMNANVSYSAAKIVHVKALPLDRMSAQIKLDNSVLQLDPLKLGVAGGELAGRLAINGKVSPTVIETRLDARAIELNRLFPTIKNTKSSLGKISGQVDLKGSGSSTAQVLASSSGNVAFLMGAGEISNILLEFVGLDGGEIIKFMVRGDRNVRLRCAAAAFDVQKGLMTSKAIVLDTVDTVIVGAGAISLADETLNIRLEPSPKDTSILSLRSPLNIGGTFGAPTAGPDKGALAGRAAIGLALAVLNPLLALAATIETGPGQDADCKQVIQQAAAPRAAARLPAGSVK
ncbi:MAG: AsmA family protein [Polaromonas sp.]|uniref:AsmA family protein n=1 Tax=Polaromonas sp. TaxID=1869339 RepID=UPI0017E2B710|nr:AsmA family protein [Polaromonas sp.]MBA3593490.1 AsmA family protein [Polaromonas sp.]